MVVVVVVVVPRAVKLSDKDCCLRHARDRHALIGVSTRSSSEYCTMVHVSLARSTLYSHRRPGQQKHQRRIPHMQRDDGRGRVPIVVHRRRRRQIVSRALQSRAVDAFTTMVCLPKVLVTPYGTHVRTCTVGVCCPVFAPSFNWLPCILPKHTWFSVHMCALFQSESCDITL